MIFNLSVFCNTSIKTPNKFTPIFQMYLICGTLNFAVHYISESLAKYNVPKNLGRFSMYGWEASVSKWHKITYYYWRILQQIQHPDFCLFFRDIFLLHSWRISSVRNSTATAANFGNFEGSRGARLFLSLNVRIRSAVKGKIASTLLDMQAILIRFTELPAPGSSRFLFKQI